MGTVIWKNWLFCRQDATDLFLGNYQVEDTEGITKPSPLRQGRDWKFYAVSCSNESDRVETILLINSLL